MSEQVQLQVGANYEFIDDHFDWTKSIQQQKQIFVLQGGSGSGKTYDILQWLITYCDNYFNWNKSILVARATYADCRDTVLKDFIKILKAKDIYDKRNHMQSHPQKYTLYGNVISFDGLNSLGSHGERNDVVFINEAMEVEFDEVQQLNMRCNEILFMDYNPVYTDHFIYDKYIPREDCKFFKSTQLDNAFLPAGQRAEILAYEPTLPADRHLPKEQRRPNTVNIAQGTADDYAWEVYGLGNRASMRGLIFPNVNYIDKFPDIAYHYGMDFGFTVDPMCICKVATDQHNIYAELLSYQPVETALEIHMYALKSGININLPTTADSSDKYISGTKGAIEMVKTLKALGWRISKVSKTQSLMFWLTEMKQKRIHIVQNQFVHHARKEFENYTFKEINGIAINQPIDKFNHCIDAIRYAFMAAHKVRRAFA